MTDPTESARRSDSGESSTRGEAQAPGVVAALRAATTERHELLHEIMPLSVESVALSDYLAHVAVLREWLVPLEAWLAEAGDGPQSPALPPRIDRVALIDADLDDPSIPPQERIAGRPTARAWHGAESAAYRWGVCYVIEGSQLGGAVLYARLHERLAPHPLRFLAAGRESLGPRWRAFTQAMTAEVQSGSDVDDACRGAADAFDRLIEVAQRPTRAACTSVD
ncbi:biliverdin-producing heme oxygenase [Paraburkholderia sp. GAS199]|uniref:biliverdin-producing heme oxygenase n=1 Tax=Paraburkholderia sp. GAS199 TaxID=3035126 RepID=UPI003D213F72